MSTSGVENTGIENSVRVAFAQIGRVKSDAETTAIQGITCSDNTDNKVTGICRTATIWEPNDTNHITNAINWYDKSCSLRTTGTKFSYTEKTDQTTTHCNAVANGSYLPTYAISRAIDIADYVDIYDGLSYNKYAANTVEPKGTEGATTTYDKYMEAKVAGPLSAEDAKAYKLVAVDTFTETERDVKGAARNVFMTLAPNSITKVRVYVYIEGQDVDNYDFASLGKAITVNFGFTKERFYAEDINYDDDPELDADLYRNYRVDYEGTSQENVKDLPTGVTYKHSTTTLTIPRTLRTAFEFKDGEATKVAKPTVAADGTIDWTVTTKTA